MDTSKSYIVQNMIIYTFGFITARLFYNPIEKEQTFCRIFPTLFIFWNFDDSSVSGETWIENGKARTEYRLIGIEEYSMTPNSAPLLQTKNIH